ncbi:hypothetical protein EV177_009973 [Coemansia sp. RSA 1804]|nr:hypothetical protein EV177_009973 [Coemansia sp. RSA 1804]
MGNSYQQSYEKSAPSDEDIKLWAKEIQRCHLKPETCFYEGDDSSVSDLSSIDSVPSRYSGSVVLYPLTN